MSVFKGFGEKAYPFLKALDFHQDRDWFKANKELYESELNGPRGDLIDELSGRFAKAGIPLSGDRKRSVYRIYRDIRFAKDKRPFNRHVSIILSPDGSKRTDGCFYVHVGLEESFMAMAFYSPEPEQLKRLRQSIATWPEKFRTMVNALDKNGLNLEHVDALKRMPQGFESVSDPDLAEAIRNRHFFVRRDFEPERTKSPAFADDCVDFAKRALPLFEWGMAVI